MVEIIVKPRSKAFKELVIDQLSLDSDVSELTKLVSVASKLSPSRIRLTVLGEDGKHKPLDTSKSFAENGIPKLSKDVTIYSKDMGPQIGWTTVFVIEYLGPLLIHPFFYYLNIFNAEEYSLNQKVGFVLILLHFIKRELETLLVHRFSNATMPFFNVFKNSAHYWILSGFNLSFFIYSKQFNDWKKYIFHVNNFSPSVVYAIVVLWAFSELSNLKTHITLSSLRDKDPKNYVIPFGYGFDLLASPNYFFESLSFFFYAVLVGNWSSWVFLAVSVTQMYIWSVKKHKRYLKTFGDDYKKLRRKVFVPFVI